MLPLSFGAVLFAMPCSDFAYDIFRLIAYGHPLQVHTYISGFLIAAIIFTVCILFAINAAPLKKFLSKTKYIWAFGSATVYLLGFVLTEFIIDIYTEFIIFNSIVESFIVESLLFALLPTLLESVVMYFPIAVAAFLLILWLADPYKKPRAPRPVHQPAQPAPIFVPVQPAPTVADPYKKPKATKIRKQDAEQTEFITSSEPTESVPVYVPNPEPVNSSIGIADEIAKYQALLDSGSINQSEFDTLKANIIKKTF